MQYYRLPGELLDDIDDMKSWVEKAIAVARNKKKKKPGKARTPNKKR